jgi:uncharacterized protein (TIGR02118 family)
MYRMNAIYGTPVDPAEFDRYYRAVHIPLAFKMSQLIGWRLTWVRDAPGTPEGIHLIATLYTRTAEDLRAMLSSPEGRAASADVDVFATGGVRFVEGEEEVLL